MANEGVVVTVVVVVVVTAVEGTWVYGCGGEFGVRCRVGDVVVDDLRNSLKISINFEFYFPDFK